MNIQFILYIWCLRILNSRLNFHFKIYEVVVTVTSLIVIPFSNDFASCHDSCMNISIDSFSSVPPYNIVCISLRSRDLDDTKDSLVRHHDCCLPPVLNTTAIGKDITIFTTNGLSGSQSSLNPGFSCSNGFTTSMRNTGSLIIMICVVSEFFVSFFSLNSGLQTMTFFP